MTDKPKGPQRRKLDLNGIGPNAEITAEDRKRAATEIATESGFTTRHTPTAASSDPDPVSRRGRKRGTGRTTQFTVKLKPETNNLIYDIADEIDARAIAEVIEQAMDALEEKLRREKH